MATEEEAAILRRARALFKGKPLATFVREAALDKAREYLAEREVAPTGPAAGALVTAPASSAVVESLAEQVAQRALEIVGDTLVDRLGTTLERKKDAG